MRETERNPKKTTLSSVNIISRLRTPIESRRQSTGVDSVAMRLDLRRKEIETFLAEVDASDPLPKSFSSDAVNE